MYEAHRDHYSKDDEHVLVWQADTRTMNPTIDVELIQRELERDPDGASAEWLATFRTDLQAAFSLESLEACTVKGRSELSPSAIIAYSAFTDPSGGKADSFTVAIGHKENRRAVIDLVRAWAPPFDPGVVTGEIAEVLKGYGVLNVTGDNYAGKWPVASFRTHGIAYERCEKSKSEMYLAFVPVTNSGDVELPDNKRLLTELRRLERKRGRAGKDTVDHPPRLHDDLANSVAGVSYLLICEDEFERIFPSVRESSRACARKQQTIMYIQYQKADALAGDEKWIATDTDEKRHNYKRMVCAVVLPEERERRGCAVIIAENTSRQRPQRSSRCLQPSPATGRTSYRRSGASAANGNFQF